MLGCEWPRPFAHDRTRSRSRWAPSARSATQQSVPRGALSGRCGPSAPPHPTPIAEGRHRGVPAQSHSGPQQGQGQHGVMAKSGGNTDSNTVPTSGERQIVYRVQTKPQPRQRVVCCQVLQRAPGVRRPSTATPASGSAPQWKTGACTPSMQGSSGRGLRSMTSSGRATRRARSVQ